jgi:SAM-dependent methyltransferase
MTATTRPEDHRSPANPAPKTEGKTIRWTRLYDLGTTLLSFGQLAALHRRIVELAGIRPGERILDVGCGPGRLAIVAGTAAGAGGEACGIDPCRAQELDPPSFPSARPCERLPAGRGWEGGSA